MPPRWGKLSREEQAHCQIAGALPHAIGWRFATLFLKRVSPGWQEWRSLNLHAFQDVHSGTGKQGFHTQPHPSCNTCTLDISLPMASSSQPHLQHNYTTPIEYSYLTPVTWTPPGGMVLPVVGIAPWPTMNSAIWIVVAKQVWPIAHISGWKFRLSSI